MLVDSYNRNHDYLRISLTDRCNLRCTYCMPHENYDFMPTTHLMQPDELLKIVKVFVAEGVQKIRLTGGEPTTRRDFPTIVHSLSLLPVELALTTNASLLHRHFDLLRESSLNSLNISLDTLDPELFFKLTKRNRFIQTYSNIEQAIALNFDVKVNMVVMKGINDHEIERFVEWACNKDIEVRFIEFMPFTGNEWSFEKVFPYQEILNRISQKYSFTPVRNHKNSTSQKFKITGHRGQFGIISSMTNPFCGGCNRMRLTADGKMKNCLFSDSEYDILGGIRRGEDITSIIKDSVLAKKEKFGGQFDEQTLTSLNETEILNRSMIGIGG